MEDLKVIQNVCLNIVKDIDRVCQKYNINYSLCGGSVIGAKLYNGFIPWDDDIDLMMDRKNYEEFIKCYTNDSEAKYKLVNYRNTPIKKIRALFTRVVDPNYETIETVNNQNEIHGNVFVDITVFDSVKSKFDFKIKEIKRGILFLYYYKLHKIYPNVGWKKTIYKMLFPFINISKFDKKIKKYERKCSKNSNKNFNYCSELMGTIFPGKLYTSDLFNSYKLIKFENLDLMIVSDYDKYLFQRYNRKEFTKSNRTGEHSHIRLIRK